MASLVVIGMVVCVEKIYGSQILYLFDLKCLLGETLVTHHNEGICYQKLLRHERMTTVLPLVWLASFRILERVGQSHNTGPHIASEVSKMQFEK